MTEKEIITAAMKSLGWNQTTLAKKAGYSTQSAVSNRMGSNSMRVDTFVRFLSAMGYKLEVKSMSPQTNKNKWVVREGEYENGFQEITTDYTKENRPPYMTEDGKIKLTEE